MLLINDCHNVAVRVILEAYWTVGGFKHITGLGFSYAAKTTFARYRFATPANPERLRILPQGIFQAHFTVAAKCVTMLVLLNLLNEVLV